MQQARTRARQRLTGAAVLLGIGIIGFPLLFETQPRPIPVDIPITIPNKDNAPPLVAPAAASGAGASVPVPAAAASRALSQEALGDEVSAVAPAASAAADAGAKKAPDGGEQAGMTVKPAAPVAARPPGKAASGQAVPTGSGQPDNPAPKPTTPSHRAAAGEDAARARALLDGKPASAAATARFVVQVGAFADVSAAHQARVKVEKLGLKTYTQAIDTSNGRRIRVRVGPFGSRDEANAAAAKIHAAGLPSAVLTL